MKNIPTSVHLLTYIVYASITVALLLYSSFACEGNLYFCLVENRDASFFPGRGNLRCFLQKVNDVPGAVARRKPLNLPDDGEKTNVGAIRQRNVSVSFPPEFPSTHTETSGGAAFA
jgi:hypothetical protein